MVVAVRERLRGIKMTNISAIQREKSSQSLNSLQALRVEKNRRFCSRETN